MLCALQLSSQHVSLPRCLGLACYAHMQPSALFLNFCAAEIVPLYRTAANPACDVCLSLAAVVLHQHHSMQAACCKAHTQFCQTALPLLGMLSLHCGAGKSCHGLSLGPQPQLGSHSQQRQHPCAAVVLFYPGVGQNKSAYVQGCDELQHLTPDSSGCDVASPCFPGSWAHLAQAVGIRREQV